MANYKEQIKSGTVYQRCSSIRIENPLNLIPSATFSEEMVFLADIGREVKTPTGGFTISFNPSDLIEIRDPNSGEFTGETATHEDLYKILWSLYMKKAEERDEAELLRFQATPETQPIINPPVLGTT